jgi:hypothetical protein
MRKIEGAQASHHQCRAGGAIRVEISITSTRPPRDARQQLGRRLDAVQRTDRQQPFQRQIQICRATNTARGIHPPQNGMHFRRKV